MNDAALIALPNYRRVSDHIGASGMPTEAQLGDIARAGFEVVINLDQQPSRHALPDERGAVEALGMIYEPIPVVWDSPGHAEFARFCAALERYAGRRIFVHCVANYRASVFIALYRIRRLGWSPADALAELTKVWQPNEIWQKFIESELAQ